MDVSDLPPTSRRVELNTDAAINDAIRARAEAEVIRLEGADLSEYDERLAELAAEWDVERLLQANASTLVLLGVLLGWRVNRRFLLLPTAVLSFFLQHALQGWCPPIPLFRRLGVRTVREIERERYALKALRGDFDEVPARGTPGHARVRAVLRAVDT